MKVCKKNNSYFCIPNPSEEFMTIGIIVAMDKEFVQLCGLLTEAKTEQYAGKSFTIGKIGDKTIVMQKCGIGKVNAAVGAVEMIDHYQPGVIISTGCAGGAASHLHVTDVVVGTEYRYHDVYCGSEVEYGQLVGMPAFYTAPAELIDKALHLSCDTPVHGGLMVSGDWFVDSQEKMRGILKNFPQAIAVDMESCAIAQVCHLRGVPFISFRVISDVPLSDDKASQYFDFWNRLANGSFEVTRTFIQAL